MERKCQLVLRWSGVTGTVIAAFWAIYSIFGDVPSVTGIKMGQDWTIVLPFTVSRWWDIGIGPLWSIFFVLLLTSKAWKSKYLGAGLVLGLVLGLTSGLVLGLVYGLTSGLVFGLVYGLGVGLTFGLVFGLVYGLGFGLVFGLGYGLGVGLTLGLTLGLVLGLVTIIKMVARARFWSNFGDWMMAREKPRPSS